MIFSPHPTPQEMSVRGLERAPPGVDTEMWRKLFQPRHGKLEIHVESNHNTWWAMPHELSEGLLKNLRRGNDQCIYEWDWQGQRAEYDEAGEETTHVQYSERGFPNILCRRAPWFWYRANRVQRSRDAAILRITSLGCATERTSYRGADLIVINKKGHQHQQQHQQHELGVNPRAKTCQDLP